jgi:trans-aconitate methyltransferase
MTAGRSDHWENVYQTRPSADVSWFQAEPAVSLRLVRSAAETTGSIVDVGGGTSTLVDRLLADGFRDLTIVDVSESALTTVRERIADRAASVTFVGCDLSDWTPDRTFDVWHDRAVFHFLTDEAAKADYVALVEMAVPPDGIVVLATFAPDGPTSCSGLPVARYDAESLAAQFTDQFILTHSEREQHVTPAGHVQPFTWVMLRHSPSPQAQNGTPAVKAVLGGAR